MSSWLSSPGRLTTIRPTTYFTSGAYRKMSCSRRAGSLFPLNWIHRYSIWAGVACILDHPLHGRWLFSAAGGRPRRGRRLRLVVDRYVDIGPQGVLLRLGCGRRGHGVQHPAGEASENGERDGSGPGPQERDLGVHAGREPQAVQPQKDGQDGGQQVLGEARRQAAHHSIPRRSCWLCWQSAKRINRSRASAVRSTNAAPISQAYSVLATASATRTTQACRSSGSRSGGSGSLKRSWSPRWSSTGLWPRSPALRPRTPPALTSHTCRTITRSSPSTPRSCASSTRATSGTRKYSRRWMRWS